MNRNNSPVTEEVNLLLDTTPLVINSSTYLDHRDVEPLPHVPSSQPHVVA